MRLALCQMLSTADKDANGKTVAEMARQAAAEGADLVVFPEFAMYATPSMSPEFVAAAESLDGQWVSGIRALAVELRVAIVVGLVEPSDDPGKAYNTLLFMGPDGKDLAVYRKQHLYDAFGYRESDHICAGPLGAPPVVQIGDVGVAIATCYDLRFPEVARLAADAGAELLVYPAAWVPGPRKEDHWKVLARARAIENTVFTAGVGQAPPVGIGSTLITDPSGLVVGELGESTSTVLVRDIDPRRVSEVRLTNPSLANRRYRISTPA
jgi:predicted amidohydrolase